MSSAPSSETAGLAGVAAQPVARQARAKSAGDRRPRPKLARPDGPSPTCPRCQADSEHTKFCYYNNYNVHQPRYYCKACQRHWTAGGTLRKVESGAGKRNSRRQRNSGPLKSRSNPGAEANEVTSTLSPTAVDSKRTPGSGAVPTGFYPGPDPSGGAGLGWAPKGNAVSLSNALPTESNPFLDPASAGAATAPGLHAQHFNSAELPDDMFGASNNTNTMQDDTSQALADVDMVLSDEALDAMFAPIISAATTAAVPQGAPAGPRWPTPGLAAQQQHMAKPGLSRTWSASSFPAGGVAHATPDAGAPVGNRTPQIGVGPSSQVPVGAPGHSQHQRCRSSGWAGSQAQCAAQSGAAGRGMPAVQGPQSEGGRQPGAMPVPMPLGWLPFDHPDAEAQRTIAANAAREAALAMQRQVAYYGQQAAGGYMPPQTIQQARGDVPGHASAPNSNVASGHNTFQGAVPTSVPSTWPMNAMNSSSASGNSMAMPERFNTTNDFGPMPALGDGPAGWAANGSSEGKHMVAAPQGGAGNSSWLRNSLQADALHRASGCEPADLSDLI